MLIDTSDNGDLTSTSERRESAEQAPASARISRVRYAPRTTRHARAQAPAKWPACDPWVGSFAPERAEPEFVSLPPPWPRNPWLPWRTRNMEVASDTATSAVGVSESAGSSFFNKRGPNGRHERSPQAVLPATNGAFCEGNHSLRLRQARPCSWAWWARLPCHCGRPRACGRPAPSWRRTDGSVSALRRPARESHRAEPLARDTRQAGSVGGPAVRPEARRPLVGGGPFVGLPQAITSEQMTRSKRGGGPTSPSWKEAVGAAWSVVRAVRLQPERREAGRQTHLSALHREGCGPPGAQKPASSASHSTKPRSELVSKPLRRRHRRRRRSMACVVRGAARCRPKEPLEHCP